MAEKRLLILVVDDEPNVVRWVKRMLEPEGYEIITATDGSQALALATEKNPELVLLDIIMPGKSGLEVFRELRVSHSDTAVIMATVVTDLDVVLGIMREGAFDYLTKPFHAGQLVLAVERALEKRRLILENREYQLNLERKVAEQTQFLELRMRELTALNNLFVRYLNEGFATAEKYERLARGIIEMAGEIQALAKEHEALRLKVSDLTKERDKEGTS